MNKILTTIFIFISTLNIYALDIPKNHIVTTDWLYKNINNNNLVLIDTRDTKEYINSHIKGSVNYPKKSWFQGKLGNIVKYPNSAQQIQTMLQNAGVTQDSIIVFYSAGTSNKDFADAASGFWNLWLYGIKNIAILNGGYAKWIYENKDTTNILPKIEKSDFEIEEFDKTVVAGLYDVVSYIYDDEKQLTDARVNKFYTGNDNRKDLARHGRIPTAKLTPMIRYSKSKGKYYEFLAPAEAKKLLNNGGYGIQTDKPLIVYCNTGHKARGLWFVAKFIINMKDVRVYDGSMVEYSRTNMAIETGESMD